MAIIVLASTSNVQYLQIKLIIPFFFTKLDLHFKVLVLNLLLLIYAVGVYDSIRG